MRNPLKLKINCPAWFVLVALAVSLGVNALLVDAAHVGAMFFFAGIILGAARFPKKDIAEAVAEARELPGYHEWPNTHEAPRVEKVDRVDEGWPAGDETLSLFAIRLKGLGKWCTERNPRANRSTTESILRRKVETLLQTQSHE